MPIRTNRGRAAVYRKLWGWPLRSPRHLAVAVFALVVLIVSIGFVAPGLVGDRTPRTSENPVAGAASAIPSRTQGGARTSTPAQTRLTGPSETPSSVPPAPGALAVARQWTEKWVNHPTGITTAQWVEGMRPFTTEEFLPRMETVDPRNVRATRVTGEPKAVRSYPKSVQAEVPTDAGDLLVTVIDTGAGQWRVADYEQGD
ncbi:hypothetical protein ACOBQX_21515 [Actinokineospora sp. G85]|uniref:hypothetical protein n=1 Tax=Actinokineospora sp. G85 TaxID=3406626 RepID=UPI003C757DF6